MTQNNPSQNQDCPQGSYPQQPGMNPANGGSPYPVQQYMVSFGEAISRGFSNYANFSGRASRSEFWWWNLFSFLLNLIPLILMCVGGFSESGVALIGTVLSYVILLPLFIPSLALIWRRLHDIGRSGAWVFLTLIPMVNIVIAILLIVWYCTPSKQVFNEYGDVPNQLS